METRAQTEKLYELNVAQNLQTHITVSSINTKYPIGRRLQLIRRSLMALTLPHPAKFTGHFSSYQWADSMIEQDADSLITYHEHGHRKCLVHILSKPMSFGLASDGSCPPPITASRNIMLDLKGLSRDPLAAYHKTGYQLSPYPTLACAAIPKTARVALKSKKATVLCHVRGLGDNYDAHNIVLPLVHDSILEVTGFKEQDIFLIPTTIQATSPNPVEGRTVLIEENVLTVMYNPVTVNEESYVQALQSLGLADSSQTVTVTIRGIRLEYIVHPDVILTRPVPTHSLEKITCVLIPLKLQSCGIHLTNLLIASGTISSLNLLHLVVLPRNPLARYEYSSQRLYLFLRKDSQFFDALATGTSEIRSHLAPQGESRKTFYHLDHLPGVRAAMKAHGPWSRNRFLIHGTPLSQIVIDTSSSPSVTPSSAVSSCTTSISTPTLQDQPSDHSIQHLIQQQYHYSSQQALLLENSSMMVQLLQDMKAALIARAPGVKGLSEVNES